ncbi:MAG: LysM peptidoglycan-binding domain-containing protein [Anaerolineae bacterium]
MLLRRSVFLLVLSVFAALFTFPVAAQESNNTVHTVQRGENLYRIALRYGVSMDAIAEANSLTNLSRINAGQQLIIPNYDPTPEVVENPTVAGTPIKHLVTSGETLASIANQYGMTVEQILAINDVPNPNRILRGQELLVWGASQDEPTADSLRGHSYRNQLLTRHHSLPKQSVPLLLPHTQ